MRSQLGLAIRELRGDLWRVAAAVAPLLSLPAAAPVGQELPRYHRVLSSLHDLKTFPCARLQETFGERRKKTTAGKMVPSTQHCACHLSNCRSCTVEDS